MKDSVKLAATKFQAWKRDNPDPGYWYDEIEDFTSSLSRGELLAVFEWLEESASNLLHTEITYPSECINDEHRLKVDELFIMPSLTTVPVCPKCSNYGIVQDEHGNNSTCQCHYE